MVAPGTEPAPVDGFVIEIACLPDGSFQVSTEPLTSEATEGDESPGKPAKTFGEALKIALQMYQNDGQDDDAQLAEGYNGGAEPPESVSMAENTDMAVRN